MTRHKLTAADFFIIRVPRQSTKIVQDLPTSRTALDDLLDSWLTQASTQEALYLASPALLERAMQAKAAGKRDLSLSLALLKYLVRSSTRPTPFGLFAGICMGTFGERNCLQPGEPSMDVRCTRLDMALLEQVRQKLVAAAGIDSAIRYQLNPTLLQLGNTYHYIETYLSGNSRQYRLSKLDLDPALQLLLSKFTTPQTLAELATVFQQLQPTPEPEEIHDYLLQLKQAGVLQAELKLPLTSGSPDAGFIRSLYAQQQDGIAEDLQRVLIELKQLDDKKQTTVKQYQQLQHQLQQLTATPDAGQVFQLDLWRNFQQAELSRDIANEVSEVMLCLQALMPVVDPVLSEFKQKFNQRFEGQLVPLLLLLDEEAGIPYSTDAGYATPLLAGIAINSRRKVSGGNVFHPLEHKLSQLLTENATQTIKLESRELLKPFQRDSLLKKFSGSCAATISVYQDEQQQPLLHWQGCFGPSAANIIGRFCHLSTDLAASVQKHLRQEEALASQAIFAEVLHMPDGRPGNVIARPRLRRYEIVFLADTETEMDAQIPVSDLYVYMEAGELKLYSARLQRQILPRLSSAHNYSGRSLGIYRFLATMQHQETQLPNFKLPALFQQLRRIPRIQIDHIIVQPAQWRLDRAELQSLLHGGNFNPAAWQALQDALQLERYVCYAVGDNVLTIDLNNPWSISMLLAETVDLPRVVVKEALLFKYQSGVKSATGHFAHEIVIPFLNPMAASASALPHNFERRLSTTGQQRNFAPGSEWLSLKIFAAQTSAELLLQDKLTSFIRQAMAEQWCQQWFFIRYNDPDWHLRLRFRGEPALLYGKLLPALATLCQPELQSRQVHKIELFTYEREFDRYGGENAMLLIERWFAVDSDCTLTLLSWSEQDSEQLRLRWMVQLINTVLEAFDLSSKEQLAVISRLRSNFGTEFREHHELRRQLGRKYRQFQSQLEQDLAQGWAYEPAHDNDRLAGLVFNYANAIRPLAREINNLAERGLLSCSIELLLGSLLHMSHNRIFRAYGREQEFVVYDFVRRLYLARQARAG